MESSIGLDRAATEEARRLLTACCGSTRWVDRMLDRRPFGGLAALLNAAREEWFALSPDDWREAFAHHPRIGGRDVLRARFTATRHLSEREQSGVSGASEDTLEALADGNREYERKFGYIFIICASGRRADEILDILRARLRNNPESEILQAAHEQARITGLRLEALDHAPL
jgi:2-oxo-4-hydroxy-4-carboxy-5-ureidoimidazoline decarboxylase